MSEKKTLQMYRVESGETERFACESIESLHAFIKHIGGLEIDDYEVFVENPQTVLTFELDEAYAPAPFLSAGLDPLKSHKYPNEPYLRDEDGRWYCGGTAAEWCAVAEPNDLISTTVY